MKDKLEKILLWCVGMASMQVMLDNLTLIKMFWDLGKINQDPEHHPEGDVLKHTILCAHEFEAIRDSGQVKRRASLKALGLAVLGHDIGKIEVTYEKDGRIVSPKHASCSEGIMRGFLEECKYEEDIDLVCSLVKLHHHPHQRSVNAPIDEAYCVKLENQGADIELLACLVQCDQIGRRPFGGRFPDLTPCNQMYDVLEARKKPKKIITGKLLVQHGIIGHGPEMGFLIKELYRRQLAGEFNNESDGLTMAREIANN